MKQYLILATVWATALFITAPAMAQLRSYQFEELDSLQQIEKRVVVVFIHADWCRYCQAMKQTTFKNNSIINLLNKKFYFISLDAEERRSIRFNQQVFQYKPSGINTGTHELARQLGTVNNKLDYPTLCILNPDNEIMLQYPQFILAKALKTILTQLP